MPGRLSKIGWVLAAVGTLFATSAARAADPAAAPTVETQTSAEPLRALIGDGGLQPSDKPAIIRLGPADADWSDNGAPIDLPLYHSLLRSGVAPGGDDVTCLTQAVYYEARSESVAGQEGVAQVVMNRTRTPGYPTSVCNVVYERKRDRGACQFTFACDGSMNRLIDPAAWAKAHDVAAQALHGYVYAPLALATHYHAAWMTPYWAGSLTRIRQIGGHVFYQ